MHLRTLTFLFVSSSVYVFDLQLHNNLKELCIHRGSVQSICCISTYDDQETVATGGGEATRLPWRGVVGCACEASCPLLITALSSLSSGAEDGQIVLWKSRV